MDSAGHSIGLIAVRPGVNSKLSILRIPKEIHKTQIITATIIQPDCKKHSRTNFAIPLRGGKSLRTKTNHTHLRFLLRGNGVAYT